MKSYTKEEIEALVQERLDEFAVNFYRRNYPGFNIQSGHNTIGHGIGEFCMTTDTSQGIQFYKQGNCKVFSRKSFEIATGDRSTDKDVAVSIRAENGHIVIEAYSGDLTLRGNNIILETTDADGSIVAKPSKVFQASAPEIDLQATKMTAVSTLDMTLAAADMTLYGQNGPVQMGDGTEPIIGSNIFETAFNAYNRVRDLFKP